MKNKWLPISVLMITALLAPAVGITWAQSEKPKGGDDLAGGRGWG